MLVKRLFAIVVIMAAVAVPAVGASASMTSTQTIAQIASSDSQLSTLVSLVKEAGLVKALSGSTKLTVFAPTNAAFAALPKATLAKDPAELAKVLEYHIVAGVLPAAKVLKLHSAKTLEGARVTFHVSGGHAYIDSSEIIKTNIYASNGVVHVINKVLTPPS
jgi:uncharacterized surface protein with fasciclin (FAS1) repeats